MEMTTEQSKALYEKALEIPLLRWLGFIRAHKYAGFFINQFGLIKIVFEDGLEMKIDHTGFLTNARNMYPPEIVYGFIQDYSPWVDVNERQPKQHQTVAFVTDCERCKDEGLHRRVLGGRYQGKRGFSHEFSTPGMGIPGSHWMPLPEAPDKQSHIDEAGAMKQDFEKNWGNKSNSKSV